MVMDEKRDLIKRNNDNVAVATSPDDPIEADVTVEPVDQSAIKTARQTVTEDVEQIGKSVAVGRKEVYHEDGRNVISVIINAISVRINMPRGTVKLLLACLVALVIVALMFGANVAHSSQADKAAENAATESAEQASGDGAESKQASSDDVLALKDYVNISPHFYYHLPDNVKDVWNPEEPYAENETLCNFTYDGDLYTIRSYMLYYNNDEELADTVKADLSRFDDMQIIDEEYIDGKYGEILKITFETKEDDGTPVMGTGYYWNESIPKICCMEVTSDKQHDGAVEEMVKDSIYRVSSGGTTPYEVDENAWDETQKEEAMDSMAEDAMRDAYEPEPDPSDGILKP